MVALLALPAQFTEPLQRFGWTLCIDQTFRDVGRIPIVRSAGLHGGDVSVGIVLQIGEVISRWESGQR